MRRLIVAAVLGVLSGQIAAAETLQDAWNKALGSDAGLAAAGLELRAAQSNEKAARGARWPSLDTGATYTRYAAAPALDIATPGFAFRSPPIFSNNDAVIGYAQLTLPLYAGGSLSAGVRAAGQAASAAMAMEQQTRADLKLDVAAAYFNVLRSRRALRSAQSAADALAAHNRDVSAMVEQELVGSTDMLAAKVALANAEQLKLRAANSVELATAQYNRRVGDTAERIPDLSEVFAADPAAESADLPELISAALAQRSELLVLGAQAAARNAQARAELGKALPQLALVAQYNHVENTILDRQDMNSVGIGFRWNLFDGGQTRNRAAALRRDSEALQLRTTDLRSQVQLQVRESWLTLGEARSRIAVTRESVAQADENLRTSRELYAAGLASNTQVLDAVALALSASNNRDDAVLDAEFARLRLARAIGSL